MKIENNNISFQSKIKFIDYKTFKSKVGHLSPKKHEVGWPWTADTMKLGKNLFTTQIMDCIAVVIVDGKKAKLGHIATYTQKQAKQNNQKGFSIDNVKRRLLENINLDNENLHGFIIGGFQLKPNDKNNAKQLAQIQQIFEKNSIPYSIFGARKDVHYFGKFSLFYSNKEDTLYISNNLADIKTRIRRKPEIEIKDNLVEYNTYKKELYKNGVTYKSTRQTTGLLDFFKSQFRKVSLCEHDTLV